MKPSKDNFYRYNRQLRPLAHRLGNGMTKAEACLWKYVLRAGGVKGFTFRRQRPVLQYIADFLCKELMLIIEVDGISHDHEEAIKSDRERQRRLEDAGFTVIRFTDEEVLTQINAVQTAIEEVVERIQKEKNIPPPGPRQRGKFPPL